MQHGICKTLLFSTLSPEDPPHQTLVKHEAELSVQEKRETLSNFQNYSALIVFIIASLSVMAFPFTSGFVTKNLLKGDIPNNAKIIVSTSTLLTTTVYVRLIWSRVQTFLRYNKTINTEGTKKALEFRWFSNQFYLCICSIAIIVLGLSDLSYINYQNIVNSLTATVLGIILYSSVVGLQTSKMVQPVTRTLDLVGAPFVVAALLLANLLYFKI